MNVCRIAALDARSVDSCAISVKGTLREKEVNNCAAVNSRRRRDDHIISNRNISLL